MNAVQKLLFKWPLCLQSAWVNSPEAVFWCRVHILITCVLSCHAGKQECFSSQTLRSQQHEGRRSRAWGGENKEEEKEEISPSLRLTFRSPSVNTVMLTKPLVSLVPTLLFWLVDSDTICLLPPVPALHRAKSVQPSSPVWTVCWMVLKPLTCAAWPPHAPPSWYTCVWVSVDVFDGFFFH